MRRVIAYIRVSTDAQADAGYGIEAQRERIAGYAKVYDLDIAACDYFVDDGESGATLNRKELRKLIALIEAGAVSKVIVARLDRLSRDLRNLLNVYADVFEKNDTALISVSEQFDTATPIGKLFFQLVGSFAEYERDTIKSRLSGGRKAKATTGGRASGRVPYGYRVEVREGRRVDVVDESQASVVRRILALHEHGKSLHTIASALNVDGVKAPRGGEWSARSVKVIIDNPIYSGEKAYNIAGEQVVVKNAGLAIAN